MGTNRVGQSPSELRSLTLYPAELRARVGFRRGSARRESQHAVSSPGAAPRTGARSRARPHRSGRASSSLLYGQQVPPLGQQSLLTSEMQREFHVNAPLESQQVGSWAQTACTQVSPGVPEVPAPSAVVQAAHSAGPVLQTSWHAWFGLAQVGAVVVVVDVVVVVVVVVVAASVVVVVVAAPVVVVVVAAPVVVVVVAAPVVVVVVTTVVVVEVATVGQMPVTWPMPSTVTSSLTHSSSISDSMLAALPSPVQPLTALKEAVTWRSPCRGSRRACCRPAGPSRRPWRST